MMAEIDEDAMNRSQRTGSLDSLAEFGSQQANLVGHSLSLDREHMESPAPLDFNGYGNIHNPFDRQTISQLMGNPSHGGYGPGQGGLSNYPDLPYALQAHSPTGYSTNPSAAFRMEPGSIGAYPLGGDAGSPGWMNMGSPPPPPQPQPQPQYQTHMAAAGAYHQPLRYPVLNPLLGHLSGIVPVSLACDLVDLYFSSSSSAHAHPMSPYVLGFIFRKRSFLHPRKPRPCQPALLASMLWVAAQTSDAPFLTQVPSARGKICQKLLELTVNLLRPLIHTSSGDASPLSSPAIDGVSLGGLGVSLPNGMGMEGIGGGGGVGGGGGGGCGGSGGGGDPGAFGAAGSLDDVVTYIHLATVVSASEYKGASMRWWNAAWSLARELKLGRELPPNAPATAAGRDADEAERGGDPTGELNSEGTSGGGGGSVVGEEEREERRRIWWLVYVMDRHLALCYNRPLSLLDIECEGLLQPMDDTEWQNGNFGPSSTTDPALGDDLGGHGCHHDDDDDDDDDDCNDDIDGRRGRQRQRQRRRGGEVRRAHGPQFECTGHSIFGYFLPLMTILGEIVDLHHARNHPRFGVGFRPAREWDDQQAEIVRHLETYEASLKSFERRHFNASTEDKNEQAATATATLEMPSELERLESSSVRSSSSSSAAAAAAASINGGGGTSGRSSSLGASRMTESDIQTRIVASYGTHVMHVLHILLTSKWDPINLLDDNDLWISSQSFITATGHAVSAAEAIGNILEFDPGLEFMPFFYGIYLLQGSFLLLLIADKLQGEASASVVRACETIIRAHEACVVTLNTEYQRNFSRVMRSALAQVRGRVPEDLGEQHQRRRELLALYRWTGDGSGLAL
ncbi:putative transcriptional activator xlnR [Rosellinia necatrix]|nr:putative transcriptional activator xlnR [Rosellinia necatrix]